MKVSMVLSILLAVLANPLFAEELPTAADEKARLEALAEAQTPEQIMDNLTPAELAEMMGIPADEAAYEQWLETQPELLFTPAQGIQVAINVSIGEQSIYVDSPEGSFSSRVSTGRKGYPTKRGCHTVKWMSKMHYSKKYDNAPMPHSIFYHGGFAIHATYEENRLGRPASHGCVRVSRATAKQIFRIVSTYGRQNTQICVN